MSRNLGATPLHKTCPRPEGSSATFSSEDLSPSGSLPVPTFPSWSLPAPPAQARSGPRVPPPSACVFFQALPLPTHPSLLHLLLSPPFKAQRKLLSPPLISIPNPQGQVGPLSFPGVLLTILSLPVPSPYITPFCPIRSCVPENGTAAPFSES